EIALTVAGRAGYDEGQPGPPRLEVVGDVEHPDELAQARVDHACVAAIGAHHGIDLLDAHAARAAVLGRELDPSPAGIVHRSPPEENRQSKNVSGRHASNPVREPTQEFAAATGC